MIKDRLYTRQRLVSWGIGEDASCICGHKEVLTTIFGSTVPILVVLLIRCSSGLLLVTQLVILRTGSTGSGRTCPREGP